MQMGYCCGPVSLSVCLSAAFVYCAKMVLDRAMKLYSIMESHARIPYQLLVFGYDDPKGSRWGNPKMVPIDLTG